MWENFKCHQENHSKVQREHSLDKTTKTFDNLYLFSLLQYFWICFLLPLSFEYLFYCHLFSLNCCDNLLKLQTKENHTVLERHSLGVNWWIDGSMNINTYIHAYIHNDNAKVDWNRYIYFYAVKWQEIILDSHW